VVQGWDENGREIQIQAKGLFAHVLQHEIDHLEGILIIDRGRVKEKSKDVLLELEENFKKEKSKVK
ncbi:peptide deformylase, partial [Candidatus Aerophobetes bacterium]|nr:peptide deformylase [Candidatus Aerophobetes bacterium]